MSGVVFRCQNCGTTQATLGECEACHEGQARYFCPNHTPGRWLDEPACSACGARIGVPGRTEKVARRAPPAPPPPSRPRSVPTMPPARRPTRRPAPVEDMDEPEVSSWPYREREARRDPEEVVEELIRAMTRGGSPIGPSLPSIGGNIVSAVGCVGKAMFFLMMLAAAFFFGILGFSMPGTLP